MIPIALGLGGLLLRVAALAVVPRLAAAVQSPRRATPLPEPCAEPPAEVPAAVVAPGKVQKSPAVRLLSPGFSGYQSPLLQRSESPTEAQGPPFTLGRSRTWAYLHRRNSPINFTDPSGLASTSQKEIDQDCKLKKKFLEDERKRLIELQFRYSQTQFLNLRFRVQLPEGSTGARFTNARIAPSGTDSSGLANQSVPNSLGGFDSMDIFGNIEFTNEAGQVVQRVEFIPRQHDITGGFQGIPLPFSNGERDIQFE